MYFIKDCRGICLIKGLLEEVEGVIFKDDCEFLNINMVFVFILFLLYVLYVSFFFFLLLDGYNLIIMVDFLGLLLICFKSKLRFFN